MVKNLLVLILATASVVACSTSPSLRVEDARRTEFEQGARDFQLGDSIIVEEVLSTSGKLQDVGLQVVRGTYDLRSRDTALLYLGTTRTTDSGSIAEDDPRQSQVVSRGAGVFELVQTVSGPGHPHVTFYDRASGDPFGGVYFGKGATLLREKSWTYAR